jgi:hypothetical protein
MEDEVSKVTDLVRNIAEESGMEVIEDQMCPAKKTIRFTWGGYDTYNVNLCIEGVSLSTIYFPIVCGLKTPREAQEISSRANENLAKWLPDLYKPIQTFGRTEPKETPVADLLKDRMEEYCIWLHRSLDAVMEGGPLPPRLEWDKRQLRYPTYGDVNRRKES